MNTIEEEAGDRSLHPTRQWAGVKIFCPVCKTLIEEPDPCCENEDGELCHYDCVMLV